MSNGYLETKLQELPGIIENKEKEILTLKRSISNDERSKKYIEIELKKAISSEKNSDDKLKFSNEKSREDELFLRMNHDNRAVQIRDKLEDDNDKLDLFMIEYKRLLNEFSAFKSIAIMKGGN